MTEISIGYAEAIFLVCGIIFIIALVIRVFDPRRKAEMRDHANIPFRGEDRDG
ncbi:MAG: cbb3-type cytochrome c oxidase subunit 3 [Pseudomonadota bacterium]